MARQIINTGSAPDAGDGDTLPAGGDKINDNFAELYAPVVSRRSGRYYPIINNAIVLAGSALQSGTIRCTPFWLYEEVTITELGTRVTTASSGQNFQLAIYANDAANTRPTGAPLASTGNISATTAAGVGAAITQTSVTLPAGLYWFCTNCSDGTIALQALSTGMSWGMWVIGEAAWADLFTSGTAASMCVQYSQTFGTWPDLTGVTPTNYGKTSSTLNPYGGFKVA